MILGYQLAAFISILTLSLLTGSHYKLAAAKPLTQTQVKFRRLPPKEFSASLGSSITVECEAGASPPPIIHWLKDGIRISQNEFDENQLSDGQPMAAMQLDDVTKIALSSTRSRLFIDCADISDEATYTCVAENAYSRVSAHTKLNLIKPPSMVQLSSSGNENDLMAGILEDVGVELAVGSGGGSSSSLEKANEKAGPLAAIPQCLSQRQQGARATDSTPARIHMWTHNIVEIMKNNVILYCRSNLRRQPLASSQLVSQSQQQDTSSSSSSPELTNNSEQQLDQQQDAVAPTSAAFAADNESQQLASQATVITDKRLLVSWTLPDDKLVSVEQKDKYEILETGDLLIKDLRWSDMGSYVCTVSDDQGSDSISAFVYPASVKPSSSSSSGTNGGSSSSNSGANGSVSGSSIGGSIKRSTSSIITSKLTNQANRLSIFDR